MAVTVRVQNFQSVEDATIVIDGLTVITGTNNSGKTAVMRAIRGVFTNAPAGPLVRHGCAHLSVTLTFDDGTSILWEKGWEKPGRKGKTVNRYTINGKQIATVGRGVPPEVEALGVREISAASDRVWPQVADQHTGNLFLVDRPGSAVAEALSDVERVGKLTAALKASEKDRRATTAELKVRRKDVEAHKQTVERYNGLDAVSAQIAALADVRSSLLGMERDLTTTKELRERHETTGDTLADLAGFDPDVIPDSTRVEKLSRGVSKVTGFRDQYASAKSAVDTLAGFDVDLPDPDPVRVLSEQVVSVRGYRDRHVAASKRVADLSGLPDVEMPTTERLDRIRASIDTVNALWVRYEDTHGAITGAEADAKRVADALAEAESEVQRLLGDRGLCPTCNTIHEGAHP
jgi:exonuclease SbcC